MPLQNATKSKAALSGKKGSQTVYQFRKTGGGDTSFAQYVEHLPEAFTVSLWMYTLTCCRGSLLWRSE